MRSPYRSRHDDDDSREATWARVLKANYDEAVQEPMPDRFRELLEQLKDAESRKR
jgi:ADP-heptose:LPS heptosyltransferase